MPASEIILDLERGEVFEWGALLVTVLAFPEDEPPPALMESCWYSLCSLAIRGRVARDPRSANQGQPIKPIYAFHNSELVERDLRHLSKRLRHRMLAGKMVIPFLQEALTGETPELPPGVDRLFLAQMAKMVLEESGYSEPKHVIERIWRPSSPVIHFAAAITIVSSERVRLGYSAVDVARLVMDRAVIESVVQIAAECIPFLAKSPRARVNPEALIRVRLAA